MDRAASLAIGVVVLTAGLAGCIGSTDEADPDPDLDPTAASNTTNTTTAALPTVSLVNCSEHAGFFPLTPEEADEYTPEGFEAKPPGFLPAFPTPVLEVFARVCTQGPEGEPVREIITGIAVDPPDRLRNDSAERHLVQPIAITDDEAHLEAYRSFGLPFEPAEVTVENASTPAGAAWTTHASGDSVDLRLATTTPGPREPLDGGTARVFGVDEGNLTGVADLEWTSAQGRQGEAVLAAAELMPVTPERAGVALHLNGFDETWRLVDLTEEGET